MAELAATTTGNNNVTIQIVEDNNTVGGASLRLVPWRDEAIDRPVERDVQILNPAYRAVTMVGREEDLGFFKGWLEDGGIRATALVGRGGTGKTRFALELLAGLGEDWQGGFLKPREACRVLATENLGRWVWRKNTLIVVDYAASLRTELAGWLEQLASHGASEFGLRILLLERHAKVDAGWYKELVPAGNAGDRVAGMLEPREPRELTELPVALRRQVLAAGLEAVARVRGESKARLPAEGVDARFDGRLADPRWADPLLLLMAALVAYQNGVVEALGLSRADVARRAAAREAARLKRRATDTQGDPLLIHLVACAILRGTLSREEARDEAVFCKTQGLEYHGGPARAVGDLERLTGASGTFERMKPDLLAEAFLLEDEELADGQAVLRMARGGLTEVVRILKLAAQDLVGAEEHRPVEWLEVVLEDEALTYEMLLAFETALEMSKGTVALLGLRLKLFRKMLERHQASDAVERARALNNLSTCESAIGDRAGALRSIREAVEIYRVLHGANPDAIAPDLAMSLNNLSNRQSAVGDRAGALRSIREAVEIYRGLHGANPDAFASDLAMSLNNLSNCESAVGDRAGSLRSIREAVEIRRGLHGANPDAFASDLASSLNNLSTCESAVGDRADRCGRFVRRWRSIGFCMARTRMHLRRIWRCRFLFLAIGWMRMT
jgi:tetratricopeptide (TPR) repeat protein